MQRLWMVLGAIAGFGAVAMAAVAAHAVHDPGAQRVVESGVRMEGWHALALIGVGLWAPRGGRVTDLAGAAFAVGMVMFCAAVYSLGLFGTSLGVVAPLGGTVLMLGWLLLAVAALRPAPAR
ncbi:MAG TPA: DUF423 domain-containing protein [Rhodopila sp.]|uniref:DUF423 domain-containing protein n=1 Tax=Rhodopila sp. TaxID=2480087 RepID=UPI002C7F0BF7|nr:DUF423 domain-containing protein [Rhodopila sp.]HVY17890.1 DUF423 domain-containing protein [Rhodopila sp.]